MIEKVIRVINNIGIVLVVVGIFGFGIRGASMGFDKVFWAWIIVATLGTIMTNFKEEWLE